VSAKESPRDGPSTPKQGKSKKIFFLLLLLIPLALWGYTWAIFPSDRSPDGAYLRIVKAVNQGRAQAFFAYTEEEAQHACFSIRDYRKKTLDLAVKEFPPERLPALHKEYGELASASTGEEVFALIVKREGWLSQLRADVSGIERIEEVGPRATITTAKGTRYSLRRRPNGIWGLTAFTPALRQEAQAAARDFEQVQKAALDFSRVRAAAKESR